MKQSIITAKDCYKELDNWIGENKVFLVCDNSLALLDGIRDHLDVLYQNGVKIIRFSDFQPNPSYESVVTAIEMYHRQNCNAVMAIGGGSAIDVAKCVKLFSNMNGDKNYLDQIIVPNSVPFLAMPTTAGTGSEATRYAVIYYKGAKQSITDPSCIPDTVLMDSSVLKTLPLYQKKATMLDALCHAIESFWSVNSTEESKMYSREAIHLIMTNMYGYLNNNDEGNKGMLLAANMAGKAINISQTTAAHAMCYKITSLFGCAHGHAAALCLRMLFPYTIMHTNDCIDPRGEGYLKRVLIEISKAMECSSVNIAAMKLLELLKELKLDVPEASNAQFDILRNSVNPVRLRNHPVRLDEKAITKLYHSILRSKQ